MKKIALVFLLVLFCFSSNAQKISVYKNDVLVSTYINSSDENYQVVVTGENYFSGDEKTHEVVDLGLSVKWATCNLGASNCYESGNYYAWGELSPKDFYYSTNYKYCNCSDNAKWCYDDSHYTKYNSQDNITVLEAEDDAATVIYGSGFRMPTQAEYQELINNCTWTYDSVNKGCIATASNGNCIFFPASGYLDGTDFCNLGVDGYYWTSTLSTWSVDNAYDFHFGSGFYDAGTLNFYGRARGRTIRAVLDL